MLSYHLSSFMHQIFFDRALRSLLSRLSLLNTPHLLSHHCAIRAIYRLFDIGDVSQADFLLIPERMLHKVVDFVLGELFL